MPFKTLETDVTVFDMPEELFRGLEPLFRLPANYMGRFKGGSMVSLASDNLPDFDIDVLNAYLREHGLRYQVTTTQEWQYTDDGDDMTARPTTTCGCGYELVWVNGAWQHDAAPALWGDDHDADPDDEEPSGPAREYWDAQDLGHPHDVGDYSDVQ